MYLEAPLGSWVLLLKKIALIFVTARWLELDLQVRLSGLTQALDGNDVPLIRNLLKGLVPGYQPEGDVVDWVWLEQQAKQMEIES